MKYSPRGILPRVYALLSANVDHARENQPRHAEQRDLKETMNKELRERMISVCSNKIEAKGVGVGLSFYAFFKNENSEPSLLMEVAQWWIMTHKLNHFEKATKIRRMVEKI